MIQILALLLLHQIAAAAEITLYDPDADPVGTQTLPQQGWGESSTDFLNLTGFYSAGSNATDIDTTSDPAIAAGFMTNDPFTGNVIHPGSPVLDSEQGFTVHFRLAINHINSDNAVDINGDGKKDESGFSHVVLDSDTFGISIGWLEDTIFVFDDDHDDPELLFTQAESVTGLGDLGDFHDYAVTIYKDAYRLDLDGKLLLQGRCRNYESFEGIDVFGATYDPFDKPNSINFGDTSFVCDLRARLSDISVETNYEPDFDMSLRVEIAGDPEDPFVGATWNSVPGLIYQVQTSSDLKTWVNRATIAADLFVTSTELEIGIDARQYVRILRSAAD